jgi:arginine/lysine/ornithine decarboxylase
MLFYISTSGILAAIMALSKLHSRKLHKSEYGSNNNSNSNSNSNSYSKSNRNNIAPKRPILILGRDSHKSAFDAIGISNCDAVLLPCAIDSCFGVPLGSTYEYIERSLQEYNNVVNNNLAMMCMLACMLVK